MTSVHQHVNGSTRLLPTNYKPPKKLIYNKNILENPEVRTVLLQHQSQVPLKRPDVDRFRNPYKKQLCINMLMKGLHKSFSELQDLLNLQISERFKLGSEHPIWDRPLLDQEPDKLDYLCDRLNKAEEAERQGLLKVVYNCYHDLANRFLATDDSWLSDYFFKKCLQCVSNTEQQVFDPQKAAESHCNLGLAFERQSSYYEAMNHFEQYYNLSKSKLWLKRETDLPYGLENELVTTTAQEEDLFYDKDNRVFTDACINLQRIYKIIAKQYAKTIEDQTNYLTKAYEVCKDSGIEALEGQVSKMLGDAYKISGDVMTALKYYDIFYEITKTRRDVINFGHASEDIAFCYQKLGDIHKSIDYLQKYLSDFSVKENDKQYARVCSRLAEIYNSLGKYETACGYAGKSYEISQRINKPESIEYNRVLFGISKAHQMLRLYNQNIENNSKNNVNNLILWKNTLEAKNSII